MLIDFSGLPASQVYQMMTQTLIPRPVAWVLTANGEDASEPYNLAPFSYFTAVSSDPALVMLSIGKKPDGDMKDTRRNLVERGHCVIHIAGVDDAEAVNQSAASLDYGVSEIAALKLGLSEVDGWSLPRLSDAKVAMYCSLYDVQEIGPNKQGIMFCEVKAIYVDDSAVSKDEKQRMKIDAASISPLARLGAGEYADFGKVFSLSRPK